MACFLLISKLNSKLISTMRLIVTFFKQRRFKRNYFKGYFIQAPILYDTLSSVSLQLLVLMLTSVREFGFSISSSSKSTTSQSMWISDCRLKKLLLEMLHFLFFSYHFQIDLISKQAHFM